MRQKWKKTVVNDELKLCWHLRENKNVQKEEKIPRQDYSLRKRATNAAWLQYLKLKKKTQKEESNKKKHELIYVKNKQISK